MKIGDLPNPKAAADVIKAFQKRFSAKICMAPTRDCAGGIVAAHTLSVEAMLRPISRDGHVYAIGTNIFSGDISGVSKLELRGIRETSVFNGFCQKHDRDLFSPIENEQFLCTPEQCFLHAYRAVAKECYLKRKEAETLLPPDTVKKIHGLPEDFDLQLSDFAIQSQAASLRGAEDVERMKAKMDEIQRLKDWRRLCTTVIPFAVQPGLVCNFLYAPDFDFKGRYLQRFEDVTVDLSHLMVTVIPYTSGGFALLSYLDTANSAPRALVDSLLDQTDITSALVWLIACQTENFALSPVWYDSIGEQAQLSFMQAFHSNTHHGEVSFNQLKQFRFAIPSWTPTVSFTI